MKVWNYSTVRFTLKFVNLFVQVSQVCGGGSGGGGSVGGGGNTVAAENECLRKVFLDWTGTRRP